MKFDKLNEMIPYVVGGKAKSLSMNIYTGVSLAMPGRHASQTDPPGGDAVVMVSDELKDWTNHPFKHQDIFEDIEEKLSHNADLTKTLVGYYRNIVVGASPAKYDLERAGLPGVHQQTLLYAVQALAVIEHRRYARFEDKGGGRWLPLRFSEGIVQGRWSASEATAVQKMGRPGVEMLERKSGAKWIMP